MQKLLLICCALFMGCASARVETGMVTQASAEAEPHVIWTRPLEVGFEMGRYIEGESTTKRLFGCMRVDGDPVRKSTAVPMMGVQSELSMGAEMAVATAVQNNNADGMYILLVEESVEWSGFVKETTTKVRGRALKLEDFGSVDRDRATRVRIEEASNQ
ncbi:MAG: hypothetical protein VXY99_00190 [Pseudomonadota bacterium]|nr:hypothetical protein [Pseudomonadota bacterium]